jgi:hypothetical protein
MINKSILNWTELKLRMRSILDGGANSRVMKKWWNLEEKLPRENGKMGISSRFRDLKLLFAAFCELNKNVRRVYK